MGIFKTNLINQMAGQCTYYNPSLIGKDKLTKNASKALIKDNGTLTPTPAVFRVLTSAPAQIPAPVQAFALAPIIGFISKLC